MSRFLSNRPRMAALALGIGLPFTLLSFTVVRAERVARENLEKICNQSSVCGYYENDFYGRVIDALSKGSYTTTLYAVATAAGSDGADISGGEIGIVGEVGYYGYPLDLTDPNGNSLDYVDEYGDLVYHGSLYHFLDTKSGQRMVAYAAETTTRTLEDVGSAHLLNGEATVRLNGTFVQTIDLKAPYRVFLTADGDSQGLYVAQQSASSFVVRESGGGHNTLSFDYRIVASERNHAGDRMGVTRPPPQPYAPVHRPT